MKKKYVFIAGGGTGGHIYPGVAIAKALQAQTPEIEVHFVGTPSGLEVEIIPKENLPLHLIPVGKLNFSGQWLKKIKTILQLPAAFWQSLRILIEYKPVFVLGVGGYASGPFVLIASLFGFSTGLWEPNAYPGLANRWLSRFVDLAFIVFDSSKRYLSKVPCYQYGMPIRAEFEKNFLESNPKDSKGFNILCFGGSQGARKVNQALFAVVEKQAADWSKDVRIVHQIGRLDWSVFEQNYSNYLSWVSPLPFIFDMPKYYQEAQLVICRAGASTIAEVSAFGVVPILIPLPLADGHQEKNAQSLVTANAGVMILQKDLTPERLLAEIERLRSNPQLMAQMASNLKKLYQPRSADRIASHIREFSNI